MGAFFSYLEIAFRWLQMLRSAHTSTLEPAAFNSNANYNESVREASMRLKTVRIWEGKFGYASNFKLSLSKKPNLLGIAWQINAFHFSNEVIILKFGITLVQKKTPQRFKILHDCE